MKNICLIVAIAEWVIVVSLVLIVLTLAAHAETLPAEVKQALLISLHASDKDGIHEESFLWGRDATGAVLIAYSAPGKPCNTEKQSTCTTRIEPADPTAMARFVSIDGFAHIHPRGNARMIVVQPPSKADLAFAATFPTAINIVLGAGDHKVYFYDSTGVRSIIGLKDLVAERLKQAERDAYEQKMKQQ